MPQRTSQSNVRFNDSVTEVYAGLSNKMEYADAQQAKRRGEPSSYRMTELIEGQHSMPPPSEGQEQEQSDSRCGAVSALTRRYRRRPTQREYDETKYYDEVDLKQGLLAYGHSPSVNSDDLRELITRLSSPEKPLACAEDEIEEELAASESQSVAASKEAPEVKEHRQVDMEAIFGAFSGLTADEAHPQVCVRANAGVRENFLAALDDFSTMRTKHRASVARVNKLKAKRRLLSRGRPSWAEGIDANANA